MIEIAVLLSIIVVTIYFTALTAAFDSGTKERTVSRFYGPSKVAEEIHHPTLLGGAQGAGMGGYYGGRMRSGKKDRRK